MKVYCWQTLYKLWQRKFSDRRNRIQDKNISHNEMKNTENEVKIKYLISLSTLKDNELSKMQLTAKVFAFIVY